MQRPEKCHSASKNAGKGGGTYTLEKKDAISRPRPGLGLLERRAVGKKSASKTSHWRRFCSLFKEDDWVLRKGKGQNQEPFGYPEAEAGGCGALWLVSAKDFR